MPGAPAVSVITPTYNHARFLSECIESVLGQTFTSWEQIVIDDGSTDATPDIAKRFTDSRIRYVRQDNQGIDRLPDTYNHALALCRAPLVAILEGDDYWPVDKLATLVPAFSDQRVVLAYGSTKVIGDGRSLFPPCIPPPKFKQQFPLGCLTNDPVGSAAVAMFDYRALTYTYPCSVVLRRTALEHIGGFQKREGMAITDFPTFLRLSLEGRFHFEPRTMGFWRVHENSKTVQDMDHLLTLVYEEIHRFRAEFAARLRVPEARWRKIQRGWIPVRGWTAMRHARRLLLEERWAEARPHLVHALLNASWRTRAAALAGFVGSWFKRPVEWAYRLTGRPWLRRTGSGKFAIVFPAES